MAKKIKGYKTGVAKAVSITLATGAVVVAVAGGNILSKFGITRPQSDNPYDKESNLNSSLMTEPPVAMDPSYGDIYQPDEILPDLQQPIIPDDSKTEVENMGVEYVEFLANLTNKIKESLYTEYGKTPDLIVAGSTYIMPNANNSEIKILGQAKIDDEYNYFVTTLVNTDSSLNIYNIDFNNTEIDSNQYFAALNEVVTHPNTIAPTTINNAITIKVSTETKNKIMQSCVKSLQASNLTDAEIAKELTNLKNLFSKSSELRLSSIIKDTSSEVYGFSFKLAFHTDNYMYTFDESITSKRVLASTALTHKVEQHINTVDNFNISTSSLKNIDNALYIINNMANEFENNQNNTIG